MHSRASSSGSTVASRRSLVLVGVTILGVASLLVLSVIVFSNHNYFSFSSPTTTANLSSISNEQQFQNHEFEKPVTSFAGLGLDPNYFYSPKCHLSTANALDGGCKKNPWYKPGRSSDAARVAEFQCPARRRQASSRREAVALRGEHQEGDEEKRLIQFKKHTSWMFEKFYDWNPRCASDDEGSNNKKQNDGYISGKASSSRHKHVYELQNFCLKPMGRLSGYWPKNEESSDGLPPTQRVEPFSGTLEGYQVGVMDTGSANFLKNIERLEEKPTCFYEMDLILFPITLQGGNVGHNLHRAASLLRLIEEAFFHHDSPSSSADDDDATRRRKSFENITIGYVVTDKGFNFVNTPQRNEQFNAMKYFYDVLGTSWFSVFGETVGSVRDAWWKTDSARRIAVDGAAATVDSRKTRSASALDRPVCFRRAFFWHNADESIVKADNDRFMKTLAAAKSRSSFFGFNFFFGGNKPILEQQPGGFSADLTDGRRHSFHLFGQRSMRDVATLALLNDKMRSCASPPLAPRRERARTRRPHVVFCVRSAYRRFSLQPHIVNVIGEYVEKELQGTFEVLEHIGLDVDEVIERFSKADVLIGALGAGLLWLEFMPPGAVIVEISLPEYRCAELAGINQNNRCDFGGSAAAAQQFHLSVAVNNEPILRLPYYYEKGRRHGQSHTDFAGGRLFFRWVLNKVKCVLDKGKPDLSVAAQPAPPACQFGADDVEEIARADVLDVDGDNLAPFVQMHLPASSSSSDSKQTHQHQGAAVNAGGNSNEHESVARMKGMIRNKKLLSAAIAPFRYSPNRHTYYRLVVLLANKCIIRGGASSSSSLGSDADKVLAEIHAWRDILRDVYPVTLIFFDDDDATTVSLSSSSSSSSSVHSTQRHQPNAATSVLCRRDVLRDRVQREKKAWHGVSVCGGGVSAGRCVSGGDGHTSSYDGEYSIIVRTTTTRSGGRNKRLVGTNEQDEDDALLKKMYALTSVRHGKILSFATAADDDDHDIISPRGGATTIRITELDKRLEFYIPRFLFACLAGVLLVSTYRWFVAAIRRRGAVATMLEKACNLKKTKDLALHE